MAPNSPVEDLATDKDGYLLNLSDWTPEVAQSIAEAEGVALSDAHWEVIDATRDFYAQFEVSPAMRPLVRFLALRLGADKGRSIYLLKLFPGNPAKLVSKIAGLPRPANCL